MAAAEGTQSIIYLSLAAGKRHPVIDRHMGAEHVGRGVRSTAESLAAVGYGGFLAHRHVVAVVLVVPSSVQVVLLQVREQFNLPVSTIEIAAIPHHDWDT